MKLGKYFFLVFLLYSYIPVLAQVDTLWTRRYNSGGNNNDMGASIAIDKSGNICVTGPTGVGGVGDFLTIKYDPDGDTVWVRSYAGSLGQNDYPFYVGVDSSGNFYVIGYSAETGTNFDCTVIKYAPNGDTAWVRHFGPGGIQTAYAGFVDPGGNAYAGGEAFGAGGDDFLTVKYNTQGDTLWVRTYNGPGDGSDNVNAITADAAGNVYVTGFSVGAGSFEDFATIKYSPTGDTLWVRRYNGTGDGFDFSMKIVVDQSGNVYVTGESFGAGGAGSDFLTIKYTSNGDTLWVRRFNGTGNGFDYARDLVVDDTGNVYVTGSTDNGNDNDFLTLKYSPTGNLLWSRVYDGGVLDWDDAYALAGDDSGYIYVTGESFDGTSTNYLIIKYKPDGDTVWTKRYDGPDNLYDRAHAIAVDTDGSIIITGYSEGSTTAGDFATVKYGTAPLCSAKPGDVDGNGNVLLPDIVAIINDLFRGGPSPNPLCRGDANGNGTILLNDIVYLINFLFRSGPAPVKTGVCCL